MPLNENEVLDVLLNVRTAGLPDVKAVVGGLQETEAFANLAKASVLELTDAFNRMRKGGLSARDALQTIAQGGNEFVKFTHSSRNAAREVLSSSQKLLSMMNEPIKDSSVRLAEQLIDHQYKQLQTVMAESRNKAMSVLGSSVPLMEPVKFKSGAYGGYRLTDPGIPATVQRELMRLSRGFPAPPTASNDPNSQMARLFVDELKEFRRDVRRQLGTGGKEYNQFDAQRRRQPMLDMETGAELMGRRGHGRPGKANGDTEVRLLSENEKRRLEDLNVASMASIRRFVSGIRAGGESLKAVIDEWAALHERYSTLEGVVKANYNSGVSSRGIMSRRLQLTSGGPIETVSRSQLVANPTTPQEIANNARIRSLLAPNTAVTTNVDPGFILDERNTTPVLTERFAQQARRRHERELRQIAGQMTGRRWSREAWEQEMMPISYPGSIIRQISPESLAIREAAEAQLKLDRRQAAWKREQDEKVRERTLVANPQQRKLDRESNLVRIFREFNEKNVHRSLSERADLVDTISAGTPAEKAWMFGALKEQQAQLALKGGNRREYGRLMRQRFDRIQSVVTQPSVADLDDQAEYLQRTGGSPLRIEYLQRRAAHLRAWWKRVAPEEAGPLQVDRSQMRRDRLNELFGGRTYDELRREILATLTGSAQLAAMNKLNGKALTYARQFKPDQVPAMEEKLAADQERLRETRRKERLEADERERQARRERSRQESESARKAIAGPQNGSDASRKLADFLITGSSKPRETLSADQALKEAWIKIRGIGGGSTGGPTSQLGQNPFLNAQFEQYSKLWAARERMLMSEEAALNRFAAKQRSNAQQQAADDQRFADLRIRNLDRYNAHREKLDRDIAKHNADIQRNQQILEAKYGTDQVKDELGDEAHNLSVDKAKLRERRLDKSIDEKKREISKLENSGKKTKKNQQAIQDLKDEIDLIEAEKKILSDEMSLAEKRKNAQVRERAASRRARESAVADAAMARSEELRSRQGALNLEGQRNDERETDAAKAARGRRTGRQAAEQAADAATARRVQFGRDRFAGMVAGPPGGGGGGGGGRGGGGGMAGDYSALHLIAQLAVVRAVLKYATVDIIQYAARTESLEVVTRQMAEANGINTKALMSQVSAVKNLNISTQEAHQTIQRMVFAQLDAAKSTELARVAQDAAVISGENSSETLQKIITGITTGQTRLLHYMGLQVSLQQVIREETLRLGRAPTEIEKRQAMLNKVLQEGTKIQGNYEAAMLTAEKQRGSLTRQWQEAANAIGKNLQPAYMQLIMMLSHGARVVKDNAGFFSEMTSALTGLGAALGGLSVGALAGQGAGILGGFVRSHPYISLAAAAAGIYTWKQTRVSPIEGAIKTRNYLLQANDDDMRDVEQQRQRGELTDQDYLEAKRGVLRRRGQINEQVLYKQVELQVSKYRENLQKMREGDVLDKAALGTGRALLNLIPDVRKNPLTSIRDTMLGFIGNLPNPVGRKEIVPPTPGKEQLEDFARQLRMMGYSPRNVEEGVKLFRKQFEPPDPGAILSNTQLTMFQQADEASERLSAVIEKSRSKFSEQARNFVETAIPDEITKHKFRTSEDLREFSREGEIETLRKMLSQSPVNKDKLGEYLSLTKQIREMKLTPEQSRNLADYAFDLKSEDPKLVANAQEAIKMSGLSPEQITAGRKLFEKRDAMEKDERLLATYARYYDLKDQVQEQTEKRKALGQIQEIGEYSRRDIEALRRRGDFTQNLFEIQAGPGSKNQMAAMERGFELRKELAKEAIELEKGATQKQLALYNKILPKGQKIELDELGFSRKLQLELLDIENQRTLARERMLQQQREMNRQMRVEQVDARQQLDDLLEEAQSPGKQLTIDEAVGRFGKRVEWAKKALAIDEDEAAFAKRNIANEIHLQEDVIRVIARKLEFHRKANLESMRTQTDRQIELDRLQAYTPPDELKADRLAYQRKLEFAKQYYNELVRTGTDADEALAQSQKISSDATYDYAKQRIGLYRKQIEDSRQMAGSVFDALTTRGGGGGRQFLEGLLRSTGRQIFTNVASGMFQSLQGKIAIPGQGTDDNPTWLARALSGTILQRNVDPRNEIKRLLSGEAANEAKARGGNAKEIAKNEALLTQLATMMGAQGSGVIPGVGEMAAKLTQGKTTLSEALGHIRMRRMLNDGELTNLPMSESTNKTRETIMNPLSVLARKGGAVQVASTTEAESRDANTAAINRLTGVIETALGGGSPFSFMPSGSMGQDLLTTAAAADVTGTMSAGKKFFDFPEGSVQDKIVKAVGNRFDPADALGLAFSESGFEHVDPKTGKVKTSRTGAKGVFQFTRGTADQYGIDRNDLDQNIAGGVKYLGDLLVKHRGNLRAAYSEFKGVSVGGATPANVEQAVKYASMYRRRYQPIPSDGVPNIPGERQPNYRPGDADYWGMTKREPDYRPGDAEYWGTTDQKPNLPRDVESVMPYEKTASFGSLPGLPAMIGTPIALNPLYQIPRAGVSSEPVSDLSDKVKAAAEGTKEIADIFKKKDEDERPSGTLPAATVVAMSALRQTIPDVRSKVSFDAPGAAESFGESWTDASGKFDEKSWWKGMKKKQAALDIAKKEPKPGYNPDGTKKYAEEYYVDESGNTAKEGGTYVGPDADTTRKGGKTANKVVKGAAAAGLGIDAYQQFKKGGAQGIMGGASDVLAAASLIPGPQQPFLAAAAAALQIGKMFFGDPRQKYKKKLEEQLKQLRFNEADVQERTLNTRGQNVDFDFLGRPRAGALPTSGPMAHFTEQEYKYLTNANAGRSTSVSPRYYYNNDGRIPYSASVAAQVKQLGQAPVRGNPVQLNINVSTMDSRSFLDNSSKIAEALRRQLLLNHPVSQEIRQIAYA